MSPRRSTSRDRLIRTAAQLFYEHGIHRTSVDRVVAESGLTKPTLYSHFSSKDELVDAVMAYRDHNWRALFDARIAAASSPEQGLNAILDFLEDFIQDADFRGCALVSGSVEILDASQPGRMTAARNKLENRRQMERLAREAGLADPEQFAFALSLLFEGAIVTAYVEGDQAAGRKARKAAERLIESHKCGPDFSDLNQAEN